MKYKVEIKLSLLLKKHLKLNEKLKLDGVILLEKTMRRNILNGDIIGCSECGNPYEYKFGERCPYCRENIEAGQIIYVSTENILLGSHTKGVEQWLVTLVTPSRFFAHPNNVAEAVDRSFNKRTRTCNYYNTTYKAFLIERDYWNFENEKAEKESLRKELINSIQNADLSLLRNMQSTLIEFKK